jgi:enolase
MAKITNISVDIIQDSRGVDTLSVNVMSGTLVGTFSVPSGASTGSHEAHELRDENTPKSSITKAKHLIETVIKDALLGLDATNQSLIDQTLITLDGTEQKTYLGGNATLGVSIATAKLAACSRDLPLYAYLRTLTSSIERSRSAPLLYLNMINGGKHADSPIAFQEYHMIPDTEDIEEALVIGRDVQRALKKIVQQKYPTFTVGDEGGYALNELDVEVPLTLLAQAVDDAGYTGQCRFALDVAASSFYDEVQNHYKVGGKLLSETELTHLYEHLVNTYPIISIEDPYHEDAFVAFGALQAKLPGIKVVGDDLTVTNVTRIKKALDSKAIRGVIIKPNQIGTLTETLEAMMQARMFNVECIVSHRSGETKDTFISDLAIAFGTYGIKAGAFGPIVREVKYKRFLDIVRSTDNTPFVDIIATLGPASHDKDTLVKMIEAGATFFRLNFSWGTHEDMSLLVEMIRQASRETKKSIGIIQDLSGPRVQELEGHHIADDASTTITDKDKLDIIFGAQIGLDHVAMSYVKDEEDIEKLRTLVHEAGSSARIIAKIERKDAVVNLASIITSSDGIMIARGDLGLAYPIEEIPLIQHRIITECNYAHTYVIVATQMFLSMVEFNMPSRAEITDVEIAVADGANAVMLSEESAKGKYPVEAVSNMRHAVTFSSKHKDELDII